MKGAPNVSNIPPIRENPTNETVTSGFRLAIHENLLPGDTEGERVAAAEKLGFAGIEYNADGLMERVPAVAEALSSSEVVAASVHMGWSHDFLSAHEPTRQAALDALRETFTYAVDIGAENVVMVPQPGRTLDLPDLMPFKSPIQLALELMVWHLRGYSDLAYVFGLKLLLHPTNRYETEFLHTLEQGAELRRKIKFNEHVWLAADTYMASGTESNPVLALEAHSEHVRMLYLAENHGGLPGTGKVDFGAVFSALAAASGWAVVRGYHLDERPRLRELRETVAHLRDAGL